MKMIISENILGGTNKSKYFNLCTTDTGYYDMVLNKPEYAFWVKGLDGELEWMTPMQYYKECASMQKTSVNDQIRYVNKKTSEEYKEKMLDGEKFPVLIIDQDHKTQEGRHRAFAVHSINPEEKIPVLIVNWFSGNFREEMKETIKKLHQKGKGLDEIKKTINLPLNQSFLNSILADFNF